jgi:hypothetical protein
VKTENADPTQQRKERLEFADIPDGLEWPEIPRISFLSILRPAYLGAMKKRQEGSRLSLLPFTQIAHFSRSLF